MTEYPTGTVTFLFTDIEGSTKRWEQHPQQMGATIARHDELLREAIEANGGYVFKTVGDAFCAAFTTAQDALNAALSAQRALHAEPWHDSTGPVRVRMALHTGAAEERDGDYFGQPVNRVARLLSAGHGGQVLLSLPTQELVRDMLPPAASLLDLGEHRLKDLFRPEHVFQVLAPGAPWELPSEFPPLKTLDNRPNNLPLQATPLIGREKEIDEAIAILRRTDVRLLTLTGPGGTGKTRLALQVAAEMVEEFKDGVFFVNLAPISDPNLVIATVAQALGVREASGQPLVDTLKAYLQEKQMLLVLDNFEQVVEASPQAGLLLASCPNIKVLATSRISLHLRGEKEYPVPPLALPDTRKMPTLERLTQYEAVRLFIDRATDVKPDFEVTNDNAPSVAEICTRLDGLPLAIELAAARVKILPPQAMLARLQSRLKLLTGGAKDLPVRQQTLRATIDWSYYLLNEDEKKLFRRLSVFGGGCTLEAVEEVCDRDADLEMGVLDGLASLIDKSLLRQEVAGGEPRLGMLETLREYASERLEESGEAETIRRYCAEFFLTLVEAMEPKLHRAEEVTQLTRLEADHDNLRAALRWARVAGGGESKQNDEAVEIGLRLAGTLWRFWYVHGHLEEGREQLAGVLALDEKWETAWAKVAETGHERSRGAARAKVLNGAGYLAWVQGNYDEAHTLHEASLAIRQKLGDKWGVALSLNNLGLVIYNQGDPARAHLLFEESLAIDRELGNRWGIANSLNNLGYIAYQQGDYGSARSLFEESLAIDRELEEKDGIVRTLNNLGFMAWNGGDYAYARSLFKESLAIAREIGDKWRIARCLEGMAGVLGSQSKPETAASLWGAAETLRATIGAPLLPSNLTDYESGMTAARAQLNDAAWQTAWAEGRAMSMEQAIAYALEAEEGS